jgi:hypothetical protein
VSLENNNDGSDIFWPGYVDAVTNLVLNLLFLLTIMTVAVFMFAMELGRQNQSTGDARNEAQTASEQAKAAEPEVKVEVEALRKQVAELKREVRVANELLTPQKILPASSAVATPQKSVDQATPSGGGLLVRYTDDAVTLTAAEADKLRAGLAPIVASGGARIDVVVPSGFSEAKRMGFYRAMAVRNLLIEMKLPAKRIEVSVRDGKAASDASQVRVTPR